MLLLRRDGTEIAINESAAPIRDRAGAIVGVVLVLHDVRREREYATQLSYQASHDALTGLINRREFEHRLSLALASAREQGRHHAMMYLDLDQFKLVNDTSGHAAGDELMRQISMLLQERLREGDTLARLGGDEFGVLLENCPAEHAARIADELRQTVTDFHFVWHTRTFTIGVSIGLVNIADGAMTLADVLSAGDAACYVAKEKGRNRVQVYHAKDSELAVRHGEMEWVARIHGALDADRFCLYSQEIVAVNDPDRPAALFELLVRMVDERGAAGAAHGVHSGRRALQPDARGRPVGDPHRVHDDRERAGADRRGRDLHDQSFRGVDRRRTLSRFHPRRVCSIRHRRQRAYASKSPRRPRSPTSARRRTSSRNCARWVAAFHWTISAPECPRSAISSICPSIS